MHTDSNTKKNIALVISTTVLILALFDGWQYGFFTVLRFTVFSSTAYVAYLAYQNQKEGWAGLLGGIAVLFNPFIPVYFSRDVWVVIDFVTAVMLATSIFSLKFSHQNEAARK